MMRPAAQVALAAANGRFPANTVAGKAVTDPVLAQFGKAGAGGVPMPNIPQMASVWTDLGAGVGQVDEGRRRDEGAGRLLDGRAQHRQQDRLAGTRGRGAHAGARAALSSLVLPTPEAAPLSTTAAPHEPASRLSSATAAAWSAPRGSSPSSRGRSGSSLKIALLGDRRTRSRSGPASCWPDQRASGSPLGVLVAATLAIDCDLPRRRGVAIPLKFLIPGTVFLIAFQVVPIVYTSTSPSRTGRPATSSRRARRSTAIKLNSLAQPANGTTYAMAPARDEDGNLVLLLVDEATRQAVRRHRGRARSRCRAARSRSASRHDHAARGLRDREGRGAARARPGARELHGADDAATRDPAEGIETAVELAPTLRYDPKSDTFTRIERRQGLPRQRQGLVRRRQRRGARARLADVHRLRELQRDAPRTR